MLETVLQEALDIGADDEFSQHVIDGLCAENKKLHPKYFYDKKGSEYFDQICQLDEYYPYAVELDLLPKVAEDLRDILFGRYALIEFGAGSLLKVKPILQAVAGIEKFVPIDISTEHLLAACRELKAEFTELDVRPISGDFSQPVTMSGLGSLEKIGFFPGSTIGNFTPVEASHFMRNARMSLGDNSYFLVGVDTKKSPAILHRAYNDAQGVTAKFNLNILHRINQRFGRCIDPGKFEHYAFYNTGKGCVEMHLVCLVSHTVKIGAVEIPFAKGESIHTESSFKYSPPEFQLLANKAGWNVERLWLANNDMFSIFLLRS